MLKYLNSSQLKLLNLIERHPDFWKHLQLEYIKSKQPFDIKDLKKLIAIRKPGAFNFESELKKAFRKYNRRMSLSDETIFWYWLAGLIDGDGHLRSNKKGTEIVVTMGDEDIALLYWLQHLLGGKIIPVKDKKAYRIVFLQGNCELFTIVQHLNGKLHHPNKIKGLAQMCTKFSISLNPRLSLQTLAKENPSYFNAYVRGLFDADGSIYVRGARQSSFLESGNPSEYWLTRRVTARSLRIELSIAGEQAIIGDISQYFKVSLIKSSNKPKNDGTPSTSYKITLSQSNPNSESSFTMLCAALTNSINFLPPTIKQIRLNMAKEFNVLKRPFFCTNSQVVNEQCVNWLLAWLIWPIANKKRMFELSKKK